MDWGLASLLYANADLHRQVRVTHTLDQGADHNSDDRHAYEARIYTRQNTRRAYRLVDFLTSTLWRKGSGGMGEQPTKNKGS